MVEVVHNCAEGRCDKKLERCASRKGRKDRFWEGPCVVVLKGKGGLDGNWG